MHMSSMAFRFRAAMLIVVVASLVPAPAHAQLTVRCNWGVGANAPTVFPSSTQVIATPIVLNFGAPGGFAQIAFVSFENTTQANRDGGGVLRVMNPQCKEIARFPDTSSGCVFPLIPNAPAGFGVIPDLAPMSGIAGGNIDGTGNAEIIAVVGGPTSQHRQIAAFNLVGNCIIPKWVSSATALPPADFIPPSAPAIAQLDRPPLPASWANAEIILDNKVFNANGTLRYTGFNGGGNNCASILGGGPPCPRSRTTAVANVVPGQPLPQMITGRGIYRSATSPSWWPLLTLPLISSPVGNQLVYPAFAELDPSPGPEIVVTDTMASKLFVLTSTGTVLAVTSIPSPPAANPKCGGPPMIGETGGLPGPEIGVASCTRYTLFHYNPGVQTITQVWSKPILDAGGQTTSTLYNSTTGPRIVYADESTLWVFNATNGFVIRTFPQSSATAFEGPVVASLDTGHPETTCHMGGGNVIVVSNNIWGGTQKGVRIFDDPAIGMVASCWNEHGFHITNLGNSWGAIPPFEAPSWTGLPARNTYQVQSWP
jgi:hypothetical protein